MGGDQRGRVQVGDDERGFLIHVLLNNSFLVAFLLSCFLLLVSPFSLLVSVFACQLFAQLTFLLQPSMTEFLDDHPGGREIITSNRSKDVTPIFRPRHPSDQLEEDNLPPNVHWLGRLDVEGASEEDKSELRLKVSREEEDEESRVKREREKMEERGLGVVVNMKDFEVSWSLKLTGSPNP